MMLLNSLVVALRQLRKSPGLAVLNIAGLAIGISTFLLLIAYLRKETSYDVHHNKPDQLYRVVNHYRTEVEQNTDAWVPTAIAEYIQHEGTKTISQATRLFRYRSPVVMMDPASQKYFTEENSVWADANLFEVFTFNFISGNNRSLELPHSMVVSESTALKYFGTTDVRGKSLTDVTMGAAFTISGVVRDLPSTSHFKADFICALSALPSLWGNTILNNWGNSFSYTYVRTDADPLAAAQEINALASKFIQNTEQYTAHFSLQRVTDIHLHSHVLNEWTANSDIKYVYILFAIAALILGVTIVNYINLWIARSHQRTREIGIRQAVGGSKSNLTAQFAMESVAQITLAVLVSAVLIQLCAPFITEYLGDDLLFTASGVSFWIACFFGVVFFIALVMLYPSKVIASIRPAMAIKGQPKTAAYGITLWQTLIGFQVVVTACLITAALLIRQQVSFIQERPLGYNDAQLINVSEMSNATNYRRFKEALLQNSRVTMASGVSHALGGTLYQSGYEIADRGKKVSVIWQRIHTDHDYCKTYSIPIVAGRDFSRNVAADTMNYLVNEAACRALGYENPEDVLGLEVNAGAPIRGKIIGVMKDFHFKSLHNAIEPLILHIVPDRIRFLTVRIEAGDFGNT
ncbi:MAG TPA: ABC transporter permease, partial [Chryseolinea sp.]|nr:ABC transporter permease [Chryseolinea sp.]